MKRDSSRQKGVSAGHQATQEGKEGNPPVETIVERVRRQQGEGGEMKRKILSAFAPSIPIWAVFYNEDDDSLYYRPVVAIALVQVEDCEYEPWTRLEPQTLWRHDIKSITPFSQNVYGFLGYALEDEKTREKWEREIEDRKRYLEGHK